MHPFEDAAPLEDCARKTPCSIFLFATHSKKRPDNLVFARMYDGHVLDLIEIGIDGFIPIEGFKVRYNLDMTLVEISTFLMDYQNKKNGIGQAPLILFTGAEFSYSNEMNCFKDMLLDVFHRDPQVDLYDLKGIDHLIAFTALSSKQIEIRTYTIALKKSQSKLPRVEIDEIGPRIGAHIRRVRFANRSILKIPSILTDANKVRCTLALL